ncbi:MAG: hypothetical protein DYG98_00845 [Haliscomenobacteraceae bacterium CHB4]|nr:hypothetical protein [Haliscomenobacteraceae bacterium CHB4]
MFLLVIISRAISDTTGILLKRLCLPITLIRLNGRSALRNDYPGTAKQELFRIYIEEEIGMIVMGKW